MWTPLLPAFPDRVFAPLRRGRPDGSMLIDPIQGRFDSCAQPGPVFRSSRLTFVNETGRPCGCRRWRCPSPPLTIAASEMGSGPYARASDFA